MQVSARTFQGPGGSLRGMTASQRAHAAVVYVLLLVAVCASTAGAFAPAFAPIALRLSMPASTPAGRAHSLVLMAKKSLEQSKAATGVTNAVQVKSPEQEENKKKREEEKAMLTAKKAKAPVVNGDMEECETDHEEAALKNGKDAPANGQSKKGKTSAMQLRALEAVEAFEKTGPGSSPAAGKGTRRKTNRIASWAAWQSNLLRPS